MSRKTGRRLGGFFLLVLLAAAIGAGLLWQRYTRFADAPMAGLEEGDSVVVESGDSLPIVVRKLREVGVSAGDPVEWRALARLHSAHRR